MSTRPHLAPELVIDSGDMSAQIISLPTIIQKMSMVSYDISWSGTGCTGTVTVQVSNTYSQNADGSVRNAGNWTDLTLSAPTDVTTDTGNGFIDVDQCAAYAMRLVYTPTSGTGTMNVTVSGKVS